MKYLLVAALKAYRLIFSPMYGQTCRYYPSCSAYALESVERHGAVRGAWLALRRLGRCHPWCAGGVDFVPTYETYRWWGRADGTEGDDLPEAAAPSGTDDTSGTAVPVGGPPVFRGV
ncbi:membrane protein insertion efficiency factor YidD [Haloactinopolyspora sp.]|jgi:putative membrane protein insertion efficiency factor|uniref:membrane protein insertion efficiency factor YidD n=1 Tax=Haloactinopolyspora sp. TaxID=1966353 RepID=UPI00261A2631|nr:membrane protein insertion efficiency factor YidD [Haloactinopolyspora sp.]